MLNAFVKDVLAADANANVVLAGDFNDYQFSGAHPDAHRRRGDAAPTSSRRCPENQRYTYVFNGVSQVLDHIFVTKPVTDVQYEVVHHNSEFADQASDHDPQVVRIRPTVRQGTLTLDPPAVFVGQSTTIRLAGWYPNRTFALTLDGASIGSVTTDASGAAALPLAITPAISLGTHIVKATSSTDGATATATLTVKTTLGTVVLSPPKIKSGKQLEGRALRLVAGRDAVRLARRHDHPWDLDHRRLRGGGGQGPHPEWNVRRVTSGGRPGNGRWSGLDAAPGEPLSRTGGP